MSRTLEDTDKMPFGLHRDKQLKDVPAKYLLWLYDEIKQVVGMRRTLTQKLLLVYIESNMEALKQEIKK